MNITYHGHSCFSVQSNGFTIVLDPYKGVAGFKDIKLEANMVICSHDHLDHAYVDEISIAKSENPFDIEYINCFHDECGGAKRGQNKIVILKAEDKRIAHLGDLGHELDADDILKLKDCDLLMIPVGGFYTIDAKTAIKIINAINPKMIIPMHYRDGNLNFKEIDDINVFLSLASDDIKSRIVLLRGYEQTIEI